MTQPRPSTGIRNPMPDQSDEGAKIENALLYRRLILLEVQAIKYCAALEYATGVPWDGVDLRNMSNDALFEEVAQRLARGLDLSIEEARKRVQEHGVTANPGQIESPIQG